MALLEEQFTETLNAGAPDITYEGSEGREQQIAQALWDRLPPQARMQFGSFQQFFSSGAWKQVLEMLQQQMQGQQGPQEEIQETETIQTQPQQGIGGLMPQARGMAGGGIMGSNAGSMLVAPTADGSRPGYGVWDKIKRGFKKIIPKEIRQNPLATAAALYGGYSLGGGKYGIPGIGGGKEGGFKLGNILGGARDLISTKGDDGERTPTGLGKLLTNPNFLIPAAGLFAGSFAKPDEPGYTGQGTGLNLQDIGRVANITDPKTAMAAGLRFSPDLETRKFTPAEMLESYAATDAENFSTPSAAQGGRIGYQDGGSYKDWLSSKGYGDMMIGMSGDEIIKLYDSVKGTWSKAQGGRIGAQEGGLMDLGGLEKDYRNDGGFVPIGGEEKADDVPARLSRNEFVFTADAVRNAGEGDMDRGAEVMENMMNHLEGGGKISDESQGKGAGEMFEVSERLSEVV